ncbi:Hsp70 family protein [Nocardia altamirensis]|uniref:Hsp70 family protein n=1 Tax=Nocardia altamirensis TaxID=472158 RepID=UPI000840132D|nr:Hsp70 family protein [Nocardia altamirensis]
MTTGLGFSIGAVNSMTASAAGVRTRPVVRSRRTAVTFDSAGGLRIGGIPQFSMAVTDFADLSLDPEPLIVGGRIWSAANLVAAVVNGLRDAEPAAAEAGAVATYPATYSDKEVALLRQALDLSGAREVELVPEPVAAAEWLEYEHGPLEPGFVLVYDLGGTSLDVTIVRVGSDWVDHPMVGKPVRSYDFGGRPLGAMIARYAHDSGPDASVPLTMLSMIDIDGLRTAHVHDTLDVVRSVVRSADLTLSDISRILVIGGASRPAEVARTLAELGRPLVVSADPGHTVVAGAALMAARSMALAAAGGRSHAPRVAVFSSAAVVSAVAMSAVTVFGSPTGPEAAAPMFDHFPGTDSSTDTLLYDASLDRPADGHDAWVATPAGWMSRSLASGAVAPRPSAYGLFITPVAHSSTLGPSVAESRGGSRLDPRDVNPHDGRTYADPAYFINPLPFGQPTPLPGQLPAIPPVHLPPVGTPIAGVPSIPTVSLPGTIPGVPQVNPPAVVPDPVAAPPAQPATPATGTGTTTPTSGTTTGTGTTPADTTGTGNTTSGGTTSGGTSSGETSTGTPSGNTSSGETSTGGSTSGGTSSGGTSSGDHSSSGGTSAGESSSSGGSTSGGTSSGGSTSGGTSSSGGSTSGGTSSGSTTSSDSTSSASTSGSTSSGASASSGASSSGESGGASSGGGASRN